MTNETAPQLPPPDTHCWDDDTGKDVWSYSADLVRSIVSAALAAQPQAPVALTDEQIARLWSEAYDDATGRRQSLVFARAIEAAHGITQTKEPTNV